MKSNINAGQRRTLPNCGDKIDRNSTLHHFSFIIKVLCTEYVEKTLPVKDAMKNIMRLC